MWRHYIQTNVYSRERLSISSIKHNIIFLKSLQKKIPKKFYSFPLINKIVIAGKMVHLRSHIRTLTKQGKVSNVTQLTLNFEVWRGSTTEKLMFTAEIDYP